MPKVWSMQSSLSVVISEKALTKPIRLQIIKKTT